MRKPKVDHILMKILESNVDISDVILIVDKEFKNTCTLTA